jgi:hypothetical protein
MSDVTTFPRKPDHIDAMKGAKLSGHSVIVEGRCVPLLTMYDSGETVEFTLDGRFSIDIPREISLQIAWLVAQALAIGQGYSHLGATEKGRPFAPQVMKLDLGGQP